MTDCNEWKTQKRHECANMGKVKRLELWWQLYRTSLPVRSGLRKFQADGFLFDRVYQHFGGTHCVYSDDDWGSGFFWNVGTRAMSWKTVSIIVFAVITQLSQRNVNLAIRCMMQLDCNTCDLKMYRTLSHTCLIDPSPPIIVLCLTSMTAEG